MSQPIALVDPNIESLYESGFFSETLALIEPAYLAAITTQQFDLALAYFKMIVRIQTELETPEKLKQAFSEIETHESFYKHCLTQSKYFYCLSIYEFNLNKVENALKNIEQAIQISLAADDLEELSHALLAKVKLCTNKRPLDFESLRKQMDKVQLILSKTNDIDLWVVFHLQDSEISLLEGKHELSVEKAWTAYTKSKRSHFPAIYAVSVFAVLGYVYFHKKDFAKASIYLQIAKKSLEPISMNRTNRIIGDLLAQCPSEETGYDFLLDVNDKKVKFKSKNEIDLKNQFVLIDMIKLFFEQTSPVSKNQLVESIWHEAYDPSRHDNLIYVTIKRLRNLLKENESDEDIIVRSKKGYSLKPGTIAVVR